MYLGSNEIASRYLGSNEIVASYLGDKEIYSSIIPPSLKPNVLAWWDAGQKKDVMYGLNQLVTNGDTFQTTSYFNDITEKFTSNTFLSNEKWYFKATYELVFGSGGSQGSIRIASPSTIILTTATSDTNGSVVTFISDITATSFVCYGSSTDEGDGTVANWSNLLQFNLTSIFGAGNEPTAAEFQAILTADGNQYWEGTRQVKCNPDNKYYWYDYSGNGRHMKLNNFAYTSGSGWVDSPYKYLKGDGVDDWTGRAESGFIAQDADFSYMCVFSPSADNIDTWIRFGYATDFTTTESLRVYYVGGSFAVRVIGSGGYCSSVYVSPALSSKYYVLSLVYTNSDKITRMYLNGELVSTSNVNSTGHYPINYHRGYRSSSGTAYTAQKQAIETYFNKALTADEVKLLYNTNCTRYGLAKI